MAMTADQIISSIFDPITSTIWEFITSDLMLVVQTMLGIYILYMAYRVIAQFLNMSESEKGARSAFNAYQSHRGKFDSPIYQKKYHESLREYEDYENSRDTEDQQKTQDYKDYL